ncbi:RagB/SusD family nutrient uptake outer membrane protein [Prolixibacter sp. NT017]|uniref:RagB/SusD family nutrient uptake outer membrane protein n=1 Tax=Prolixibacter sp. NT017 TaxID=2652390 RepID=UPI0012711F39|nr:RagB/SusD family nutrient uptake outer membrane protein [Prolixibacter sp. NT017]GET27277.1 membrane protein [Prolixibacter sp. NT017]
MKYFNKILFPTLVILLSLMTSCVNDLDVVPLDKTLITSANVYDSPEAYKEGLAKLYASFAVSGQRGPSGLPDISGIDEGFSNYLRQYWNVQELPTDEAVMAWNDATIKDFHWMTWTPNDVFIGAMYSRIFYTVAISNEYIRATAGSQDPDIQRYNAEARFIRALAYYHALDLFGNVTFVTEKDLPGAFFPQQISRADLFKYIETELLDIQDKLGAPGFEYGRADQGADWTLLATLYLNAGVYTGQDRYADCITYCNKVISSGAYSLAPKYANNFVADNNKSPEMIFSIGSDGDHTRSYGGMTYLIHAAIGGSMPSADFGVGGGWGGIRTTKALVNKFSDPSGSTDQRAMFWTDGQSLEINDIATFTDGYGITKFKNVNADGSPAVHPHPDFVCTDFPVFRLADVYLMYAESFLRGGGGDAATALGYVNALRERAYGDASGDINQSQLTLDFILNERARELYWEGHRRTDLIRFGEFTSDAYLWPWKGKVKDGKAVESYRTLYPIPAAELGANPNLKQNPGY